MTYEQRLERIRGFIQLVRDAETCQSAVSHATFTRGMLSAWFCDGSISVPVYGEFCDELNLILLEKYKLPHPKYNEGVPF